MKKRITQLAGMLALQLPVVANAGAASGVGSMVDGGYLLQLAGSLLLVLGCIVALLMMLKKLNRMPAGKSGAMRVIGSLKVGTREKVVLLEVGDRQLLVGVAANGVNTLQCFDEPVVDTDQLDSVPNADFASFLSASALGRQ